MSRSAEFQVGSVTHQHMLAYANADSTAELFRSMPGGFQHGAFLHGSAGRLRQRANAVNPVKFKGNIPRKTKINSGYN